MHVGQAVSLLKSLNMQWYVAMYIIIHLAYTVYFLYFQFIQSARATSTHAPHLHLLCDPLLCRHQLGRSMDTPLCVHSYIVTVRISCNSSQVMVYNTTDNRSSCTEHH